MTLGFYQQLAAALSNGAVVVATVVHSRGSVPREVGAKLFLDRRGQVVGTIGGGAGEAKVLRYAAIVLATGENQWVEIDLTGTPDRHTEGICGGAMRVWLARWQGEAAIAQVQYILDSLVAGQSVILETPLDPRRAASLLPQGLPIIHPSATPCPDPSPDTFIERLTPPPTLLIVGAGHCGIQLAKVADLIGFQVMVQDDRPEWANPHHYPQAQQIFTTAIADVVAELATHDHLYVALVTRGYSYDLEALHVLLQRSPPCAYIGMIGSRKRVQQVIQTLRDRGIEADSLRSLHAPIGLDIGAFTPEEIAVSIGAELILVRRGGSGRPLSFLREAANP